MDIFNTNNTQTSIDIITAEIAGLNTKGLDALKSISLSSFNLVWNNPNATPQQIFDGFGTNAYKLFDIAGKTFSFIASIDSTFLPPTPPKAFTINQDGTVTVTD